MTAENDGQSHVPRILVVDDNQAIHADFEKILGGRDAAGDALAAAEAALFEDQVSASPAAVSFELHCASQGEEALDRVKQALEEGRPYAMAFMDVRMPPGWDGIETTQRIWEAYPDLQVVICTAYSDYSWEAMIGKLGQSDRLVLLKKPFDNVEVLQLACCLTEKWRLLQASRSKVANLESAVRVRTEELEKSNAKLREEIVAREQVEGEQKKLELQLRSAQKLEAIGQLAAGVAHEINTPTQFIGDNLRFLRDSFNDLLELIRLEKRLMDAAGKASVPSALVEEFTSARDQADVDYLSEEIPKALSQALEGVDRVSSIVKAMKEFSHPGVSEKQHIDLNRAIESTITVSRNEWKYVAELTTEFDASLPPVAVLPGELNQVILNIIVNAAHAIAGVVGDGAQGKGSIHIRTLRDGNWVEIRIRDSGTGIPEEARAKVFDPFFTTKEVGKGTGQGLAIAYDVVFEKHGGTLDFETETGKGSTFVIRLPIEPEQAKFKVKVAS